MHKVILLVFASQAAQTQAKDNHVNKLLDRMSKRVRVDALDRWDPDLDNTMLGKPEHFHVGRSAQLAAGLQAAIPKPWSQISRSKVLFSFLLTGQRHLNMPNSLLGHLSY